MRGIRLRAAAFAARIAGRHARRALRRGIGLPLAKAARASAQHVVHRHTRFGDVINARLQMDLHLHRTVATHRTPVRRDQAVSHTDADPRALTVVVDNTRVRSPIADRLPMRATRIEAAPASPRSAPPVASTSSPLAAVPDAPRSMPTAMTLARPVAPVRDQRRDAAADALSDGRASQAGESRVAAIRTARVQPRVAPSLADGEIERLADRVIGSIDRRIAAQRERLGRF